MRSKEKQTIKNIENITDNQGIDFGFVLLGGFLFFLALLVSAIFLIDYSNQKSDECKDFCFETCDESGCSCIDCCYHSKKVEQKDLLEIVCSMASNVTSNITWIVGDFRGN